MRITDLYLNDFADEQLGKKNGKNYVIKNVKEEYSKITMIEIKNSNNEFHKEKGNYITIACLRDHDNEKIIAKYLLKILKKNNFTKNSHVLIVGLGNDSYLSDALGPKVIKKVQVTSHLSFNKFNLVEVSCFVPGVMAVTGLESSEMVKSLVKEFDIDLVIVVDSLATRDITRLYKTYQITDTGISPGSGINNNRLSLNKKTLKVPVIAIGVATVVDTISLIINTLEQVDKNYIHKLNINKLYNTLYREDTNFILTSKEIDSLIDIIASNISSAINYALNPKLSINDKVR